MARELSQQPPAHGRASQPASLLVIHPDVHEAVEDALVVEGRDCREVSVRDFPGALRQSP
jgi:hypothetical protein